MPEIIIVAGPNGAGKTSFANQYLPAEKNRFVFVNADEIARSLPVSRMRDLQAGREMLKRLDNLVATKKDFMFETTLATVTYAQKIPEWRKVG
jgi:predicted ABC-type ATPase